jgi:hypothetical protein
VPHCISNNREVEHIGMPLDTDESFRSFIDRVMLKPIGRAMINPLSLALMITVTIMLIVTYTYDSGHKFRTFLRIFGVTIFFLFVNNHVIIQDINARQLNPDQQNLLRVMERGDRGYIRTVDQVRPGTTHGGRIDNKSVDESESESEDDGPAVVSRAAARPGSGSDTLEELPDASSIVVPLRGA